MQEELPNLCNITFALFGFGFVQPFQLVHYNIHVFPYIGFRFRVVWKLLGGRDNE